MRSGNVADKETDSIQLSDHHYLGFIVEDRNLQKRFHTASDCRKCHFLSFTATNNCSIQISSINGNLYFVQPVKDFLMWMPVSVILSDRDYSI